MGSPPASAWPGGAPRLTLQPASLVVDQCGGRATPTSLLRSDGSVLFDSPVFSVTPQPRGSGKQLHVTVDVTEVRTETHDILDECMHVLSISSVADCVLLPLDLRIADVLLLTAVVGPHPQGGSDGAAAVPETPSGRRLGPFGRLAASLPMPTGDGAQDARPAWLQHCAATNCQEKAGLFPAAQHRLAGYSLCNISSRCH